LLPRSAETCAWLAIDPAGLVTIRISHAATGQGALASVSMRIAAELNFN
jgi:hypothetical protein